MKTFDTQAAAAIVGLASYQLWQAWRDNAPTLHDVRSAQPGDISTKQRLLDAEITVGSLAVIIGLSFTVLTKDATVLVLLLGVFGALAFFHHWVLEAPAN